MTHKFSLQRVSWIVSLSILAVVLAAQPHLVSEHVDVSDVSWDLSVPGQATMSATIQAAHQANRTVAFVAIAPVHRTLGSNQTNSSGFAEYTWIPTPDLVGVTVSVVAEVR